MQWQAKYGPQSRTHARLHDARKNASERKRCEEVLFALYRGSADIGTTFGQLIEVVGRRYDLSAYLFFLRDWERFMPIAASVFDEAFERLGLEARMTGQCSWENYQSYVAALCEVRDALHGEGITTARLVDAHSFCWMLIRLPAARAAKPARVRITMREVVSAIASQRARRETSADALPAEPVDFMALAERRAYIGRLAEGRALEGEKQRLTRAGHPELASRVRDVSQTHSLGYDIASFETDGAPRHIEVKAVSGRGSRMEFYVTENELPKSRELPNYWFYLVRGYDGLQPRIECLPALKLPKTALAPIVHRASIAIA